MLLLDEPTNHLDAESVEWLERFLSEFPGTVVAITHDRYFLDNVAKWILELDRGKGIPWEGNYSSWLDQKKNRLAQEEKTESARQRALQRELEWVRMPGGENTWVDVSEQDGQLKAQPEGMAAVRILYQGDNRFRPEGIPDFEFRFEVANGRATRFTVQKEDGLMVGTRVD